MKFMKLVTKGNSGGYSADKYDANIAYYNKGYQ